MSQHDDLVRAPDACRHFCGWDLYKKETHMGVGVLVLMLLGIAAVVLVGVGLTTVRSTTPADATQLFSMDTGTEFDPAVHTHLSETDMCARLGELQGAFCAQ